MTMATTTNPVVISERADIHKSCKSLETLVNTLNDYCEAAVSIVSLQKRLAKALREAAASKATGDIASNALNASAGIFEALSETDNKFSKIADKESESVSTEVRKWFKKLAKEEKTHDEKISNANARIKHAGQLYEKKAKKSARDATEEHARYMQLISSLGPEISQEKYNHAITVTQRHTLTTYSVAASLSRVADAEWTRSCEEVRRFSPTVGKLGEWRALCEGGWTGPVPRDLPDIDQVPQQQPPQYQPVEKLDTGAQSVAQSVAPSATDGGRAAANAQYNEDAPQPGTPRETAPPALNGDRIPTAQSSEAGHSLTSPPPAARPLPQRQSSQAPPSSYAPPPEARPQQAYADNRMDSIASITTLSTFPTPPTHYPIPAAFKGSESSTQQQQQASSTQSRGSSSSASNPPTTSRATESPLPMDEDELARSRNNSRTSLGESQTSSGHNRQSKEPAYEQPKELNAIPTGNSTWLDERPRTPPGRRASLHKREHHEDQNEPAATSSPSRSPVIPSPSQGHVDYLADDREFGVRPKDPQSQSRSLDALRPKGIDRSDSANSSGSRVAAMRSRYSVGGGATSPPPRDLPRLPTSVTNLASRYQPGDAAPLSPRRTHTSPPPERQMPMPSPSRASPEYRRPSADIQRPPADYQRPSAEYQRSPQQRTPEPRPSAAEEDDRWRRQRMDELEQAALEMREKEQALREREREIDARARELDQSSRGRERDIHQPMLSRTPRPSRSPQPRPMSQLEFPTTEPPQPHSNPRHSMSTTHLAAPESARPSGEHAPFCGCAQCSVEKYRSPAPSSAHDSRPPEPPINLRPEKPRGWIRRLSIPSVPNFSLDGKKGGGRNSLVLPASLQSPGEMGQVRRLGAGISNGSSTNLGRR